MVRNILSDNDCNKPPSFLSKYVNQIDVLLLQTLERYVHLTLIIITQHL